MAVFRHLIPWVRDGSVPAGFCMDPDPRIRTTDIRIRLRILRLLVSDLRLQDAPPKKKKILSFFAYYFFEGTFKSFFKDKKSH